MFNCTVALKICSKSLQGFRRQLNTPRAVCWQNSFGCDVLCSLRLMWHISHDMWTLWYYESFLLSVQTPPPPPTMMSSFLFLSMRHTVDVASVAPCANVVSMIFLRVFGQCRERLAETSRMCHCATRHLPLPYLRSKTRLHASRCASSPYALWPNLRKVSPGLFPRMTFNFAVLLGAISNGSTYLDKGLTVCS